MKPALRTPNASAFPGLEPDHQADSRDARAQVLRAQQARYYQAVAAVISASADHGDIVLFEGREALNQKVRHAASGLEGGAALGAQCLAEI